MLQGKNNGNTRIIQQKKVTKMFVEKFTMSRESWKKLFLHGIGSESAS